MSGATPPKSSPSAPALAQSSSPPLHDTTSSPLAPSATPAKHTDMGIPDGWADPINSVELGGGSPLTSPGGAHESTKDITESTDVSSSKVGAKSKLEFCESCGYAHHPLSLDCVFEQGDTYLPPRHHFKMLKTLEEEMNETGDKAAYDAELHEYLLKAQDMHGMKDHWARTILHLPDRYIGANRFKSESELEARTEDGGDDGVDYGSDDDDAEDMMNIPPSSVAPFHRPDDLHNILSGNREATENEAQLISQHRSELEAKIKKDVVHQQHDAQNADEGPSLSELEEKAGAVAIAPGVVVVDPARLDELLSNDPGVSYGSGPLPHEPVSTPPSRDARPDASRRVSFADEPTVIDTPFASTLKYFKAFQGTGVDDSPRGRTKGKENSPYKPRRKASGPDEIAQLNREAAASSEEDLSDLEKYREYDLAPLDPVMEADSAGDLIAGNLIMAKSSPRVSKQQDFGVKGGSDDGKVNKIGFDVKTQEQLNGKTQSNAKPQETTMEQHKPPPTTPANPATYELPIPGSDNRYNLKIETNASPEKIAEHMRETATQLEAKKEDIDEAVNSFLEEPESFIVVDDANSSDTAKNGANTAADLEDEHPVFIKVISMVPATMFWALVHPVAYYSNKLYEAVLEKLGGLTL